MKEPPILFGDYFLFINALTLVLYWLNAEAMNIRGRRAFRFPDALLLTSGFMGGTLTGIFAQIVFRYRQQDRSFRFWFKLLSGVQAVILLWVLWLHPELILRTLRFIGQAILY